jgi:hypothetical protein
MRYLYQKYEQALPGNLVNRIYSFFLSYFKCCVFHYFGPSLSLSLSLSVITRGSWDGSKESRSLLWDSRRPVRMWTRKLRKVRRWSCYQATTGEDRAGWKDILCAVVNCRVCVLATAIHLLVVTISKCSIHTITNPNPFYSQSLHKIVTLYIF